jgi:hypothetical protein
MLLSRRAHPKDAAGARRTPREVVGAPATRRVLESSRRGVRRAADSPRTRAKPVPDPSGRAGLLRRGLKRRSALALAPSASDFAPRQTGERIGARHARVSQSDNLAPGSTWTSGPLDCARDQKLSSRRPSRRPVSLGSRRKAVRHGRESSAGTASRKSGTRSARRGGRLPCFFSCARNARSARVASSSKSVKQGFSM